MSEKFDHEERKEIEKQRIISDAELLNGGAEYEIDESGNKRLDVADEQIDKIKNEHFYEVEIPRIINSLPDKIRKELLKAKLLGARKDGDNYAIQYTNIEGGNREAFEGQARYIITNDRVFKIPRACGHQYLDLNPNNGLPIARFSYLGRIELERFKNDGTPMNPFELSRASIEPHFRGFFDGERLMSIDYEDSDKDQRGHEEKAEAFNTCGRDPEFFPGGYVVETSSNQTIINGYLYKISFYKEMNAVLKEKYGYNSFHDVNDYNERRKLLDEIRNEISSMISIDNDHNLLLNGKVIKPIGYFKTKESENEPDKSDFVVVDKSEFVIIE